MAVEARPSLESMLAQKISKGHTVIEAGDKKPVEVPEGLVAGPFTGPVPGSSVLYQDLQSLIVNIRGKRQEAVQGDTSGDAVSELKQGWQLSEAVTSPTAHRNGRS